MAAEEENTMDEYYPIDLRYRSLLGNEQIQNFLQRHGLTTYGGKPLRRKEMVKRLQQIDDQSSVDRVAQSVIEKALNIKRPLRKSNKHTTNRNSKQSTEHDPYVSIYDNSCAITMIYCGSRMLRNDTLYSFKIQGDEVIVMQYQTNTVPIMVYKSFLKPNDDFTFKSHRLVDTQFTIAIYINGVIDSRISTCCEQGYLKQRYVQSKRSLFQLLFVSGGTPCYTCQTNDLLDSSMPEDEITQSEYISITNSDQTARSLNFQIPSYVSQPFVETDSIKTYRTKSDTKTIPSILIPLDIGLLPDELARQLTASESPVPKVNEIPASPIVEKVIGNEESEKDVKNEDKLVNAVTMKQTDTSAYKQNKIDPAKMKIANEEEKEEQGLISSVANHEMQQLLFKYLLLLLPSSKSQINSSNTTSISTNISTNVVQKLAVPTSSRSKTPPLYLSEMNSQQENIETCVLIWLDVVINMNEDTIISQTKLRAIINSLFTFHTIDETIYFIKNIKEEKIFLILSGPLGWELIERIDTNELSQLDSIYIFSRDKSKHKTLIKRDHKLRGIFTDIDPLCVRLNEDLKQTLNDFLPISVTPGTSNKNKSIIDNHKQVTFLCAQLHRELLFTMEYPDDARLNLVKFCMNIYKDNEIERKFIEELKNEYQTGKAIWWYTRPIFLHKMLDTALFRQDISMLYKFHFFIKDLHMQLEQLHNLYKSSLESRTFTVYRGLGMPMKIFDEKIRQEVHNLIAFDTFLSTNLNKNVALKFARNKSNSDDESILFQIEIDTDKLQRPFADISRLNAFECEDEILFSIGTVFRIDHVAKEKTNDGIWLVYLSSIDENNKQLKHERKQIELTLLNFFKRVWQAQIKRGDRRQIATSYMNMASMYYKQGQYQKSLNLYEKALENLLELSSPDPLTIAIYQSNIAMVHLALEQQDDALKLYGEALKIRIKYCEPNDPLLIDTLHMIGYIYREKKEFNKALKQYNKALKMQPISFGPSLKHNPSSIAATHINIALVHCHQNQTNEALNHFLKALDYQREYLSEYHPILAFLYNNIGAMYYRLKKFDLALKNQLLTLKIEEHSLPKEHKTLAVSYTNIATSYEQLRKYDEAIDYAHKAVNQLKFHKSKSNSDIQTKQAYLDKLLIDKDIFQGK